MSWWFVARVKEFFSYKRASTTTDYRYQHSLIKLEYKTRVEEITQLYFKLYQRNTNDECELSIDVERLLIGLIRKFNIESYIDSDNDEKIKDIIIVLKNLEKLHFKYFVKDNCDNINLDNSTIENINLSLRMISRIQPYNIDLKLKENFEDTLSNSKYSISEVTNLMIKLLEKLNTDVENYITQQEQYYYNNPWRNILRCPKFRKWNYNKYVEEEIRSFIRRVEIKLLEIQSENTRFDTVINENLEKSLEAGNNKTHLRKQAVINLKRLYTNYRKKN